MLWIIDIFAYVFDLILPVVGDYNILKLAVFSTFVPLQASFMRLFFLVIGMVDKSGVVIKFFKWQFFEILMIENPFFIFDLIFIASFGQA